MPLKRRVNKSRRWRISHEAADRWREVRPHGLHFGTVSPACFVDDHALGVLLNEPALLAMPEADLRELYHALEEAIRRAD